MLLLLPLIFLLYSSLLPEHAIHLRTTAAQILSHLLKHYSMTYPGLPIKIVKMLIVGLIEVKKPRATNEGAIRGLMAIGKEAVRLGLVDREGAKVVGEKCMPGESSQLVDLVMVRRMLFCRLSLSHQGTSCRRASECYILPHRTPCR